jgi:hypothetical protein
MSICNSQAVEVMELEDEDLELEQRSRKSAAKVAFEADLLSQYVHHMIISLHFIRNVSDMALLLKTTDN